MDGILVPNKVTPSILASLPTKLLNAALIYTPDLRAGGEGGGGEGGGGVSVIVGCGILNSIVSPHRETLITILNLAQFMLGYLSLSNSELRLVFLERRSQKGVSITAKDKCISAFMEGFVFIILQYNI